MIYFTMTNTSKQKRNIELFKKINDINIFDLNNADISNLEHNTLLSQYIYINANIMPLKKIKIFEEENLENKFFKKRELAFYSLSSEEFDIFFKQQDLNLLKNNYFNKELYIDASNFFTDISSLIKFEEIYNFIVDDLYNYEQYNKTRSLFHNNIEYIIEESYENKNIQQQILEYNKQILPKVSDRKLISFIKNNYFIKKLILFGLNLKVSKQNNYYLFSKNQHFTIVYFNTKPIECIKIDDMNIEFKSKKIFNKITLIKINKKEFEKLEKSSSILKVYTVGKRNNNSESLENENNKLKEESFVKNQKFRGTNYNNIKAIYYTSENIYSLRNDGQGNLLVQKKYREYFESPAYERKIKLAKILSYFSFKNKVLLYEKQINAFEESSSILFKEIFEHKNVYYLLKKDSPKYAKLKEKYGDKILEPSSFKYLFYFFRSEFIIGTEVPGHIFTVRSPYKVLREELIKNKKHKYIFLQHGVMYSLSLETASRNFFKKGILYSPYKIICSSYEESLHLQKYGFYKDEDILKTGLPTFDNKKIKPQASKIVIMLTWRPWDEYLPFNKTTYYKALFKIINNISDDIKKDLTIVFHPKIKEQMPKEDKLNKYVYNGSVDELLYETSILISDYSSVVFDAFNRGTKVIFWWEQKDECLKKYDNYLLLNEDNVFGDIVYESKDLNKIILENKANEKLKNEKSKLYKRRYQNIVEFNDNCNTKRLISKFEEIGVL